MPAESRLLRVRAAIGTHAVAAVAAVSLSVTAATVLAQRETAEIEILQVRPNFYMIVGAGANIGAQIGPNGVVLVNAGTERAADTVLAAVRKLTGEPIRYIIDTSADADVVGGNARLARAGRRITSFAVGPNRTTAAGTDADAASVFSHENVLTRLRTPGAS